MDRTRISIHDVMSGIVLCLTARGYKSWTAHQQKWVDALAATMPVIMRETSARQLKPNFRIRPNPLHGSSSTANEALYGIIQHGLVTIDHPKYDIYRPTIESCDALTWIESLPGDRAMYETLTSKVLEELQKPVSSNE